MKCSKRQPHKERLAGFDEHEVDTASVATPHPAGDAAHVWN